MGDPREGRRSLIDLVMEHGGCDFNEAADWLRERLGEAPDELAPEQPAPQAKAPDKQPSAPEWPTMDEAAYHGFAGELVKTIEPHSEADPVALLLTSLSCFGNAIGRWSYYRVEGDHHHANLFSVLVGTSSKARKGTSFSHIKNVFKIADEIWARDRITGGLSSGEGLIHAVRDPVIKYNAKESKDEVADPGVSDKRLLVVEPEFAGVLSVMERPGNNLSPFIRKAWDDGQLASMIRNSPLAATNAHISILGHVTTDELRARLTRTDSANGFANRFLFALVRRSKELPFSGDLTDSENLHLGERLKLIVEKLSGPFGSDFPERITMTEAARAEWAAAYVRCRRKNPACWALSLVRAEAYAIRLSLIYALLDCSPQIDVVHLRAGLAVWRYCESSAAYIFGAALGDEVADTILRSAGSGWQRGLTRNGINTLFGGHKMTGKLSAALGLLVEKGRARMETRSTGGRPVRFGWLRLIPHNPLFPQAAYMRPLPRVYILYKYYFIGLRRSPIMRHTDAEKAEKAEKGPLDGQG